MQIELRITADSFAEIAHLFSVGTMIPMGDEDPVVEPEMRAKEVEPETPPKKSRGKKSAPAGAATDTSASDTSKEAGSGPDATTPASPSDAEPVTFEDLRAEASSMMDSGKVDGKAIQEMLQERFGVKAFGPLTEEQYPAAMEALRDLAA